MTVRRVFSGWRRTRRLAVLLLVAGAAAACATKKDVKLLRTEMQLMQARQDSMFQVLEGQNRATQDSIRATHDLIVRLRGDLSYQLVGLGNQLVQLQELAGQSQARINDFRQLLEEQRREIAEPVTPPAASGTSSGSAADLYRVGAGLLEQGSAATARQAFEQLLRQHPQDSLAADAQLKLAETYVLEGNFDRGLRELERVAELYPGSARAPQALYRAGVVSEEQGNTAEARAYYTRVTTAYGNSEEARRAQDKLRALPR